MFKKLKAFWRDIMSEVVISREKTFTMGISELKKQAQLIHPKLIEKLIGLREQLFLIYRY